MIVITDKPRLHVISHTHWDREWYLTFEQFRFRLVALIDGLLDLLERDPEFKHFHLDGQSIVLEDYLEIRPQQRERLARLIQAGRILVGPWYVQPDEFLVSGEAIVRNLMIGRRIAAAFGSSMPVGYLPDSFGHIAQLPQMLRGFELDTFVHGRGIFLSQTGGTEYWWQGLDGSSVLGVFLAGWYNNLQRLPEDPEDALAYLDRAVKQLQAAGARGDLLLMNGVDHLVPQENLSAILNTLATRYDGGELMHSSLPDAITALRQRAGPHLRTVTGELRYQGEGVLLTGVLSARVKLKQRNNACERLLETWVEPYEVWTARLGKPVDRDLLRYAWKTLLKNHPHDSICGCSIDQVHAEMLPRFDQAEQVARELLERSLATLAAQVDTRLPQEAAPLFAAPSESSLSGSGAFAPTGAAAQGERVLESTAFIVHNPLPRPRSDGVVFELDFAQQDAYRDIVIRDAHGKAIPTQVLGRVQRTRKVLSPTATPHEVPVSRYTVAAWFSDLPPCGYRTYHAHLMARMPRQKQGMTFPGGLQNGHLRVTVRPDGSLRLDTAGLSFEPLHFFRDEGDIGDQYNYIKPLNDIVVETLSSRASVRVLHDGPALGELEVTVQARLPLAAAASRETRSTQTCEVPISSRLRLWKEARRLEVQTRLHNTVKDHRLRAVFPLGADIRSVRADTAFGVIDRPLEIPAHWGFASRDRPHRSFFEARDKGRGLAVLSRGLYEHDARPDGQLELTLLRAVGHMFVDFHSYAPLDPVEGGQCPGEHTFDYALLAHDGDLPLEQLVEEAAAFNAPLRVYQTDLHAGTLPHSMSFLSLTPTALQLSAVKPAADRDSVIVRLYNATAEPVSGRLELAGTWAHAFETNLDETRLRELHLTGSSLSLALAPWQILTVELEGYR